MKLCPSSYYKWKKRSNSKSELENEAILAEMKAIYQETDGIYGYRRLMMELMQDMTATTTSNAFVGWHGLVV